MATMIESRKPKADILLWSLVFLLIVGAVLGQHYFPKLPLLVRVSGLSLIGIVALFTASKTQLGKTFLTYWQDSLQETRRVVWPTKQETIQTTIAVFVMVLVMGTLLWSVDALLYKLVKWLMSHRGV